MLLEPEALQRHSQRGLGVGHIQHDKNVPAPRERTKPGLCRARVPDPPAAVVVMVAIVISGGSGERAVARICVGWRGRVGMVFG